METASFTTNAYPIVTRSLLADIERIAATHQESQVNQGVLSLIRARKAINDALLAVRAATKHYPKNEMVRNDLERIGMELKAAHDDLPLTILENGGGHVRPPIFKQ